MKNPPCVNMSVCDSDEQAEAGEGIYRSQRLELACTHSKFNPGTVGVRSVPCPSK